MINVHFKKETLIGELKRLHKYLFVYNVMFIIFYRLST